MPTASAKTAWARLTDKMAYISGDLTKPNLYENLRSALDEAEKALGTHGNVIFYLAIADRLFGTVVEQLGKAKLTDQGEDLNGGRRFWRRVVIEKPFGHGLIPDARVGYKSCARCTRTKFLGLITFSARTRSRTSWHFVSPMAFFEPIWNRDRIDHIADYGFAETVGVEGRGSFYEATGALRDMVPNHLFTLLSGWWRWNHPSALTPPPFVQRKLNCWPLFRRSNRRRRYGASTAPARYWARRQKPIARNQRCAKLQCRDLYVALKVEINNWRWAGVPFLSAHGQTSIAAEH